MVGAYWGARPIGESLYLEGLVIVVARFFAGLLARRNHLIEYAHLVQLLGGGVSFLWMGVDDVGRSSEVIVAAVCGVGRQNALVLAALVRHLCYFIGQNRYMFNTPSKIITREPEDIKHVAVKASPTHR